MNTLKNWEVRGSGEGKNALVLLHGFLFDKNVWGVFAEELAQQYTVILFDLPGHGVALPFKENETFEDFAQVIKHIMSLLGFDRFTLVGHSMGGYAALACAAVFPDSVNAVILINSTVFADSNERKEQRLRTIEILREQANRFYAAFIPSLFLEPSNPAIAALLAQASHNNIPGIISAVEVMRNRKEYTDTLRNSVIPLLFYAGKHDKIILPEQNTLIRHALPNAEIVFSDKSAHMSFLEDPINCIRSIQTLLKRIQSS
jgi:pimeloyl-ACP methyl ester carboxylesterase